MPIRLSTRLQQVADWVPTQARLADVGTDHALLPIYLAQTERISMAVATDVRPGPVARARRNVALHGLSGRIQVRLGYGLATVAAGEIDTVTLTGLGGILAAEILENAAEVVAKVHTLIVQPMGGAAAVRRYAYRNQWRIGRETVVRDGAYTYMVIQFQPGNGMDAAYAPFAKTEVALSTAFEFGPYLLRRPTPAWEDYVQDKVNRWRRAASGMETSARTEVGLRRMRLLEQWRWLEDWLQEIEKGAGVE
ncbi:tRNA (adenine(22)-N(1))-methyltransferase [Alicyclobacillus kakegawensis]|uniref:tRNA (adenine(22)-N(1))-methyltransferase n=1 Tax=Alicyclobacillus kakegawensis TaxID=392012 RepID=UPI000831833C|nr:class I SAM-dependent methyltransferase [Alicyclobacillus kakegawensis]